VAPLQAAATAPCAVLSARRDHADRSRLTSGPAALPLLNLPQGLRPGAALAGAATRRDVEGRVAINESTCKEDPVEAALRKRGRAPLVADRRLQLVVAAGVIAVGVIAIVALGGCGWESGPADATSAAGAVSRRPRITARCSLRRETRTSSCSGRTTVSSVSHDGGRRWSRYANAGGDAMNLARPGSGTAWMAGHDVFAKSGDGAAS
jgi:hypothetical protein